MEECINVSYPKYFKDFKCIGGSCTDSCCIGWDIDIDKISFRRYFRTKDIKMKKMFQQYLRNNDNMIGENIDYGKVKLKEDKRCPFLDDCNLCVIYSNLGEESLSNVCTFFPRTLNKVDGQYEISLDTACIEAARLILLDKSSMTISNEDMKLTKYIISSEVNNTDNHHEGTAAKFFKSIRDKSMKILQNRNLTLDKRMKSLGEFISGIEDEVSYNYDNVESFIDNFKIDNNTLEEEFLDDSTYLCNLLGNGDMNYLIRADFLRKMIKMIHVDTDVESISFKNYTNSLIKSFKLEEDCIEKNGQEITEAMKSFDDYIMKEREYIIENYLVNFIYSNLFPFSEDSSIFDGYIMLLLRYSLIKFYLSSMYKEKDDLKDMDIVNFIQSFSKTIEHHKTYLGDVLNYIISNEFNNMEFAATFCTI